MFPKIVPTGVPHVQLLPLYPSWLTSCAQCFAVPPSTVDDFVKDFEADWLLLTRKPFAMLKPREKAKCLAGVERLTRVVVNGTDVTLSVTSTGVVVLTGECLDSE